MFQIPVDSVARVCHYAARSDGLHHSFVAFGPILLMNILIVLSVILQNLSNRKIRNFFNQNNKAINIKIILEIQSLPFTSTSDNENEASLKASDADYGLLLIGVKEKFVENEIDAEKNNVSKKNDQKSKLYKNIGNCSLICDSYFCKFYFYVLYLSQTYYFYFFSLCFFGKFGIFLLCFIYQNSNVQQIKI